MILEIHVFFDRAAPHVPLILIQISELFDGLVPTYFH